MEMVVLAFANASTTTAEANGWLLGGWQRASTSNIGKKARLHQKICNFIGIVNLINGNTLYRFGIGRFLEISAVRSLHGSNSDGQSLL